MLHRKVCAAFALFITLGCAGATFAADEKSDTVALAAAGTSAVGPDYIIGQRDTLRVFVLRNPEYTADVPVRPDGKISTPLVNDMQAVGKTASQLAHDIETVLAEYLRSPTVTVIVTNAQGGNGQVRVVGQAVNPRSLPFRAGMTVLDVVIEVGGLSQYAAGNRATLIRVVNGKERKSKLKLKDLLEDGDMSQNLPIERGDVIVIPESRF
jgi:polysaccharide export outer membrane protein